MKILSGQARKQSQQHLNLHPNPLPVVRVCFVPEISNNQKGRGVTFSMGDQEDPTTPRILHAVSPEWSDYDLHCESAVQDRQEKSLRKDRKVDPGRMYWVEKSLKLLDVTLSILKRRSLKCISGRRQQIRVFLRRTT